MVQMNALGQNFALKLATEAPLEIGHTLSYAEVYFGKLYGECGFCLVNKTYKKYISGRSNPLHRFKVTKTMFFFALISHSFLANQSARYVYIIL